MTPSAEALFTFDNGRQTVNVTAAYGFDYESNLFAHAGGGGDHSQRFTLGTSYLRRAGLIKVNGSLTVSMARFETFTAQDFTNPRLRLEFTKDSGRLTGGVTLSGARESNSDTAANLRANSWNYGAGVRLRYPINSRYYFTSRTDFSLRDYLGTAGLFNLSNYAETVNMYYRYNSKLDLLAGYRLRVGRAQGAANSYDHDVHFGATGSLLPKLSGTLSAGYEWRNETGANGGKYGTVTSSLSLAWPMTKRVTFSAAVSKDFMTTATDISVDGTGVNLQAELKPAGKVNIRFGVNYSTSRYLGSLGGGRRDHAPGFNASVSLVVIAHVSASLTYAYTDNHSNVAYSDFTQHTASLNLSASF